MAAKQRMTETDFARWTAALEAEAQLHRIDRVAPTIEESRIASSNLLGALDEAFRYIRAEARVRDNWQETKVWILLQSLAVTNASVKTDSYFTFGATWNELELQNDLKHFAFLSSVGDDFWRDLARLYDLGAVKLETGCLQSATTSRPENRQLLKNERCVFYTMMRNHVFAIQDDETAQVFNLTVSWPRDMAWRLFLPKAIEAFRLLYRLEYRLYRAAYLAKRQMVKRVMKQQGWHGSVRDYMPRP